VMMDLDQNLFMVRYQCQNSKSLTQALVTSCKRSKTLRKQSKLHASGQKLHASGQKLYASSQNFIQAVKNFMQAVQTSCKRSKTGVPKLEAIGQTHDLCLVPSLIETSNWERGCK